MLHFPVFTSKNFVILKLPEPSTDLTSLLFDLLSLRPVVPSLNRLFYSTFSELSARKRTGGTGYSPISSLLLSNSRENSSMCYTLNVSCVQVHK